MRGFSHIMALTVTLVMLLGCGAAQHLPTTTEKVVTVVKDSLVIRTDTLRIPVPVESHTNVTVQESFLETSVASSTASIDSLGLLHHQLQNKQTSLSTNVTYVDRYVTQIDTVYKDVLRYQDVEVVKYKVPRWCWYLLVFNILVAIALGVYAYLKIKGKFIV